jgi:hypothetical protein
MGAAVEAEERSAILTLFSSPFCDHVGEWAYIEVGIFPCSSARRRPSSAGASGFYEGHDASIIP